MSGSFRDGKWALHAALEEGDMSHTSVVGGRRDREPYRWKVTDAYAWKVECGYS